MRESNYRSFRIELHVDFDDVNIRDRQHLANMMRTKGYHRTGQDFEVNSMPTSKQVEFAYNEMSKRYGAIINFKRESYKKHEVFRATESIIHRNKSYRKGQFLPWSVRNG